MMKILGSIILLGFSTVFLNQAAAEPFTDRGSFWLEAASTGADIPRQPIQAEITSFKDRGVLWSEAAPVGTARLLQPAEPNISGFNNRSDL
jgi:hypothetical protein